MDVCDAMIKLGGCDLYSHRIVNVIRVSFASQSIPIVPYVRTMSLEWLAAVQSLLLQSLCTTYLHFVFGRT